MGADAQDLTGFCLSQKLDKPAWCYWNNLGQSILKYSLKLILTQMFFEINFNSKQFAT